MAKNNSYHYDAFISYRHSELDKYVAETLHHLLETYKLPKSIKEKYGITRNGINRIFRDREELPLASNLEDPIIDALKNSDYLIVICSPRLKESMWCKREIETFIDLHGRDHVLSVLIEGEPKDSFPDELLYSYELVKGKKVKKCVEPLAADVRGNNKKEVKKLIKAEMLRLLAPIFDLNYDDLKQRHKERKQKQLVALISSICIFLLIFSIYTTSMVLIINQQKNMLRTDQASNLAREASELLKKDDRKNATHKALMALTSYKGVKMPYTSDAEYVLSDSLNVYDIGRSSEALYQLDTKGVINNYQLSPDKNLLLTYDNSNTLTLWNIKKGTIILSVNDISALGFDTNNYAFFGNDYFMYESLDNTINIISIKDKKIKKSIKLDSLVALNASDDGKFFALTNQEDITIYNNEYKIIKTIKGDKTKDILTNFYFFNEYLLYATGDNGFDNLDKFGSLAINIINLENMNIDKYEVSGKYLKSLDIKDNNVFLLTADSAKLDYQSHLISINYKTGKLNYEKTYNNEFATKMVVSSSTNYIAIASSFFVHLVNSNNGDIVNDSPIGESVVGIIPSKSGDMFLAFSRSGENFIIDTKTYNTTTIKSLFKFNAGSYNEISLSTAGYLGVVFNDNRVIVYNYYDNQDLKDINKKISTPEYLSYSEIKKLAEDLDLEKKNLVTGIVEEKDLAYVSYTDKTLDIINTKNNEVINTINDLTCDITYYYGKTKDGNIIVGGSGYGYILNKNYEKIAEVEGLVGYDKEKNCLYISNNSKTYQLPIKSTKELIEIAKKMTECY